MKSIGAIMIECIEDLRAGLKEAYDKIQMISSGRMV